MHNQEAGEHPTDYEKLLHDERWADFRAKILFERGSTCESCKAKDSVCHIHHNVYRYGLKPWQYEPEDVTVLCESCHRDYHKFIEVIRKELLSIPVRQVVHAIRGSSLPMADLIAEFCGVLARSTWCVSRGVPT